MQAWKLEFKPQKSKILRKFKYDVTCMYLQLLERQTPQYIHYLYVMYKMFSTGISKCFHLFSQRVQVFLKCKQGNVSSFSMLWAYAAQFPVKHPKCSRVFSQVVEMRCYLLQHPAHLRGLSLAGVVWQRKLDSSGMGSLMEELQHTESSEYVLMCRWIGGGVITYTWTRRWI